MVGDKELDTGFRCWSCKEFTTLRARAEADGNCPHCKAEIDLLGACNLVQKIISQDAELVPDECRIGAGVQIRRADHPDEMYVSMGVALPSQSLLTPEQVEECLDFSEYRGVSGVSKVRVTWLTKANSPRPSITYQHLRGAPSFGPVYLYRRGSDGARFYCSRQDYLGLFRRMDGSLPYTLPEGVASIDQPPALSSDEVGEKAVQDHISLRLEQETEIKVKMMDEPFVLPSQNSMALALIRLHTMSLINDRVLACLLAANVLLDVAKPGKEHKVDNKLDEWMPKNSLRDMEAIHWRSAMLHLHRIKFLPTREVIRLLDRAIQPRFSPTKGKRPERQPVEYPVKVCSECLQQDCNGECISNLD